MNDIGINKNPENEKEGSPDNEGGLSLFNSIIKNIHKKNKKENKRIENLRSDLSDAEKSKLLRKKGELLKANLNLVKRGMDSVTVTDYFSENKEETFTIELDPARPAREQVNKFFKQAQKYERSTDKIIPQIELAENRIKNLQALQNKIEPLLEHGEISEAERNTVIKNSKELGILESENIKTSRPEKISRKEQERQKLLKSVRRFKSHDNLEIFVGKSNIDNDTLTFRIAKGNDWWFHTAACPGSHVVVKNDGCENLPQETLLDAAMLAVYYSKMREAAQADVHYTQTKFVRRIKGAPPGKVSLERNKSIHVRMEKNRLEQIFSKSNVV